jgi:hypothetical protein
VIELRRRTGPTRRSPGIRSASARQSQQGQRVPAHVPGEHGPGTREVELGRERHHPTELTHAVDDTTAR